MEIAYLIKDQFNFKFIQETYYVLSHTMRNNKKIAIEFLQNLAKRIIGLLYRDGKGNSITPDRRKYYHEIQ